MRFLHMTMLKTHHALGSIAPPNAVVCVMHCLHMLPITTRVCGEVLFVHVVQAGYDVADLIASLYICVS